MQRDSISGALKLAFQSQRSSAKKRGIAFLLTIEEWLEIWETSGHFHERGHRKGQYVMARHGDTGPYAVGNVSIIACEKNHSDGSKGKHFPKSLEWRAQHSKTMKGRKHTAEHNKKIGDSVRGKTAGIPKTEAHRQKLREAALRYHATR